MAVLLENLPIELQNLVCSFMSVPTAKLIKDCEENVLQYTPFSDRKIGLFAKKYFNQHFKLAFKCGYKYVKFYNHYNRRTPYDCKKCDSGVECNENYEVDNKYVCEWCYTQTYPNLIQSVEWNDWMNE